jgi:peptidoglycan/LPS O-acetylase OafA/YrhL
MDRSALAARILKTDGVLLLVVALIHLAATPFALPFVSSQSTPQAFVQIGPPFLLSFIVVGILLVPIGLSTLYCADSFRRGERWARVICGFNALGVFLLPVALVVIMPARYFRAIPFLVAATLVWIVAISMTLPLVLRPSRSPHPTK